MTNSVHLSPNIPLQLALADPSGVPEDFRVHFPTSDGRTLTLPRQVAVELNRLDLRPGEPFCICKDWTGPGNPVTWRVWLPAESEVSRANQEAAAESSDLEAQLAASVEIVTSGRRKPAKRDEQPRLFDQGKGTGTYGPMPATALPQLSPAQARAAGAIPYNVAFKEVTQFITKALNDLKEQWTDQAKQDAICTILISAQKQGLLKVWER